MVVVAAAAVLLAGCAAPASVAEGPLSTASAAQQSPVSAASVAGSSPAGPAGSSSPSDEVPSVPGCGPADLSTADPGTLTLATGPNPSSPWFRGDPADGQGFEAAVAAAVADRLGYPADRIQWAEIPATTVLGGTATGYDAYLGQLTVPDPPASMVSFTTGYLDNGTVLLAAEGSPAADIDTMSELAQLRVGEVSTGAAAVPGLPIKGRFATATVAERAVDGGTMDAVVAPLSVASSRSTSGIAPVARIPDAPGWQAEQFGMVTPAGSPVTGCLSTRSTCCGPKAP